MNHSVERRAAAKQPPIGAGWPAPGPTASCRLANEQDSVSGHSEAKLAMFVGGVGRAVAPAVGPGVLVYRPTEALPPPGPVTQKKAKSEPMRS